MGRHVKTPRDNPCVVSVPPIRDAPTMEQAQAMSDDRLSPEVKMWRGVLDTIEHDLRMGGYEAFHDALIACETPGNLEDLCSFAGKGDGDAQRLRRKACGCLAATHVVAWLRWWSGTPRGRLYE